MTVNDRTENNNFRGEIIRPKNNPIAVVLIGPGLNLNPIKMRAIANALVNLNFTACLINLDQKASNSSISLEEQWQNTTLELYRSLPPSHQNLPLITLGYSISTLHFLDIVAKGVVLPAAMISMAPPIKTRLSLIPIKILAALPYNFSIRSLNYSHYRYRKSTTILEYKTLFRLQNLKLENTLKLQSIPHLILSSKKDELIDTKSLIKLVNAKEKWSFIEVKRDSDKVLTYHHLLIDPESLGQNAFDEMIDGIVLFIKKHVNH